MSWKHVRRIAHRHTCRDCGKTKICKALGEGCSYRLDRTQQCIRCWKAAIARWESEQTWCECGHGDWTHKPECITARCDCTGLRVKETTA